MAKYYLAVPDSFTIPTDGNQIALSSACILRRDDSAVPTFLPLDADGYTVFIADTGDTATATAFAISSTSPTDNATDVAVDTAITITFNANIAFGTGNITLRENDGGWADLETFDVTSDIGGGAGTVSISGAVLTIEPTADLDNSIEYAIRIDATAIDTTDGVSFAGIADDTTISFTTVAAATAPAQMSAPTVTATSDTEISVDRAAAPSDGGSAITSYDLRWSTDEATWTTVTGIADPESVTGLSASTLYYAQTRAVNAVGAGAWSASGSVTTDAASSSIADQIIAELGSDLVALYDMTDFTQMYQTTDTSTPVTAASQNVMRLVDVSGNGHHATASAFSTPGNGVSGAGFVNVNGAGFKVSGSLSGATTAMEVYLRFDRGSDASWCLIGKEQASAHAAGTATTGSSSATFGGFSGTITDTVNDVTVSPQTRSALYNAVVAAGGYCTQGIHGVDLTGQIDIMPMAYTTGVTRLEANAKFFLITKALTPTKRTNLHTILDNA